MMLKLKARHAVKPHASHAQLLSLATCKNLLSALGTDSITLDSLNTLTPSALAATITVSPQAAATSMEHNVRLPAMLPKGQFSPADL